MPGQRTYSRRLFMQHAAAASAGAALLACGGGRGDDPSASSVNAAPAGPAAAEEQRPSVVAPPPAPTPRPVPAAGRFERPLLPGTQWQTPLWITYSGRAGPTVMVLGGVHGNEPGGWLAAETLADWELASGNLIVVPRANLLATRALERTFPELGDLNRLYPGNPGGLPMARMAAAIVDVAREFNGDFLIDMHESWGFFEERTQNGTAFLGQTITGGTGPQAGSIAQVLARETNARIRLQRDRFSYRDRSSFPSGPSQGEPMSGNGETPWNPSRGGSSLAIGQWVSGLTPVLVEMGQDRQTVDRRVELHLLVAQVALELHGML